MPHIEICNSNKLLMTTPLTACKNGRDAVDEIKNNGLNVSVS